MQKKRSWEQEKPLMTLNLQEITLSNNAQKGSLEQEKTPITYKLQGNYAIMQCTKRSCEQTVYYMFLHSMKQEQQKEIRNGISRMLMAQAVNMFLLILFLSCAQKNMKWFYLLGFWGVGGWEGVRFTTLGCSGCHNVAHHLPIQIKTMVVPFNFFGGGAGG